MHVQHTLKFPVPIDTHACVHLYEYRLYIYMLEACQPSPCLGNSTLQADDKLFVRKHRHRAPFQTPDAAKCFENCVSKLQDRLRFSRAAHHPTQLLILYSAWDLASVDTQLDGILFPVLDASTFALPATPPKAVFRHAESYRFRPDAHTMVEVINLHVLRCKPEPPLGSVRRDQWVVGTSRAPLAVRNVRHGWRKPDVVSGQCA